MLLVFFPPVSLSVSSSPDAVIAAAATLPTFARHVGASFSIQAPGQPAVDAILVEAQSLGYCTEKARASGRESFRLLFRVPRNWTHGQQIFRVSSQEVGAVGDIFLVPVGRDERGLQLEAIFTFT